MGAAQTFDKALTHQHRERAAFLQSTRADAWRDSLHELVAERLLDRMLDTKLLMPRVLVLGGPMPTVRRCLPTLMPNRSVWCVAVVVLEAAAAGLEPGGLGGLIWLGWCCLCCCSALCGFVVPLTGGWWTRRLLESQFVAGKGIQEVSE